ncbi:ABC transporter permease [Actinoplanes aureus]|uniref:ABC transporter permease n=1 Tax=Actinoplanes aureus TaxID=2792083 RepID=A0A931C822_9ACTN|nr:ABC transporter permease [Actinoplanes aureus]MBG0562417.1 ABC transporter permease [Actinoplanes aureus]
MNAVWRTARAAVRRRKLQTFVIFLVVLMCTATVTVSLVLLDAASAPFDRAFAEQKGAHAVAAYDPAKVTGAQLAAARTGVEAANGPFGQVVLEPDDSPAPGVDGPLTVVGRADPGGAVDQIDLWRGRWPSAPGEIVLDETPQFDGWALDMLDAQKTVTADGKTFTVVGWAFSMSGSADAWVTPEQVAALNPTGTQMLYRFDGDVSSRSAVDQRLAGVTTGLPGGALLAAQPYLVLKEQAAAQPGTYLPFLATFGVLGLLVAVIIVANVVSGAVISGFRHIGVLKSLGFTPRQVVAVYLTMVSVPAVVGAVPGTVLGAIAARPMLSDTFAGLGFGQDTSARLWVWVVSLLGVPGLVFLAALLPARRAGRLSAAEAISAGSAPRRGRGLRVQRKLSGTRLPRAVSLGLGLPFARPGRTALTMASLLLGVVTVTFATGLSDSIIRVAEVGAQSGGDIGVRANPRPGGQQASTRSDAEVERILRGIAGVERVAVAVGRQVTVLGDSEPILFNFARGEVAEMGYRAQLLEGRWMAAADEVVAPSQLLNERNLAIGDRLTAEIDGVRSTYTVVGETVRGFPGPEGLFAHWREFADARPGDFFYQVQVTDGTDAEAYAAAVQAADPGLFAWANNGNNEFAVVVTSFSTVLALLLATVAALGVLNTVALNIQDRRRDLGMLKSIGMTPRQVVTMTVTSMAALGVAGGLIGVPIGMAAHGWVVPLAADSAKVRLPDYVLAVWDPATLALMVFSGVLIAVLGALLPARRAARLTIARVLHNE